MVRYCQTRGFLTPIIFVTSIGASFYSVTAAQLVWILVFIVPRLSARYGVD